MSNRSGDAEAAEIVGNLQTFTARLLVRNMLAADALALAPTDLLCMCLLQEHGPASPGWLAERTGLTTGAVTGMVDRLERAGYVTRVPDPHDRRRIIVRPDLAAFAADIERFAPTQSPGTPAFYRQYSPAQLRAIRRFVADLAAATGMD